MALAITWGGYADTNLDFSEFFGGAHTVAVRFMLQYPHTVIGPMLSVDGAGTFILGKGDYSDTPLGQARLLLRVGTAQVSPLATLAAGTWHFLAVVRTGNSMQLFLDGTVVGSLAVPASGLPSGRIRLGKTTFAATDGGGAQFYGLLDDVAVFTRALTAAEIGQIAVAGHLTGNEVNLHAGYVFGHVPPGGLPANLSRPVTTVPGASIVAVSANRIDAEDAPRLPLALTSLMHLPFPKGEEWFVIQGFDTQGGSHAGGASFCLDLMLAGKSQSESKAAPFHAVAPGQVDTVRQSAVSGPGNISNYITVKHAPLEMCDYLHLVQSSSEVSVSDKVTSGQQLAKVGDTGANIGAFHLHIAVTNLGEGHTADGAFVTIPAPYTNYEASDDNGATWVHVPRGVPLTGQLIRQTEPTWSWLDMGNPPGANIRGRMGAVTVMDKPNSPQRPHVFVEGNDFNLWCRYSNGAQWAWLNMGKPQGANIIGLVGAVTVMDTTTSPQRPHVFVAGSDGNLWCRWLNGSAWSWLNMGKPPSANIRGLMGAVTVMDTPTSPQRPHVFVEGNDFNLWCLYSNGPQWAWLNMGKPQAANIIGLVGAVTVMDTPNSPQRPHVFVAGNDGNLWCLLLSGSAWNWLNLGKPPSANIRGLMGAVTVMDTPTSPQRPHVFVEGNDFNLWCLYSNGPHWAWLNMGKPQAANIIGLVGAVTVMDTPNSPQRPHVFVAGNDGSLWCHWLRGSEWSWVDMGKPQGANIRGLMGAVTAMDTPTSPQRPHVFIEGNDSNLWCRWSSG